MYITMSLNSADLGFVLMCLAKVFATKYTFLSSADFTIKHSIILELVLFYLHYYPNRY